MASALSKRKLYEEARAEYTKALQIKEGTLQTIHAAGSLEIDMIQLRTLRQLSIILGCCE